MVKFNHFIILLTQEQTVVGKKIIIYDGENPHL